MLPQETRSNSIWLLSGVVMNSQSRTQIQEILRKLKSPITGQKEFINDNAVIEYAIQHLHDSLKKRQLI
jgi:hypothetical protein